MVSDVVVGKLVAAANEGMALGAISQNYVDLVRVTLRISGQACAAEMTDDDRATLYVAGLIDATGHPEPGSVLFLEDRVVICWMAGRIRKRVHTRTHFIDDIQTVATFPHSQGNGNTWLAFSADGEMYSMLFSGDMTAPALLERTQALLTGGSPEQPADSPSAGSIPD